jgi:hypothetical protein
MATTVQNLIGGGIGKTLTVDVQTNDGGSLSNLSLIVTSKQQNYKGKTYPRLTQSITAPGTGNYDFNVLPNAEVTVDLGKVTGYRAPASKSFTITGNMSVPFIYMNAWTAAQLNAMTDGNGSTIATFSSLADVNTFIDNNIFGDGYFSKENTGLRVGNVIKINDGTYNKDWYIMGFDTELGKGDTPNTRSHITLIPKTNLTTSAIHSSNVDCHGYVNSDTMYAKTIPNIVKHLDSVLGDHLLTRRVKLTNATSSGTSPHTYMASGNGYYSVRANLMCQMQVNGTVNSSYGNSYDTGDDTTQLPGFKSGKVAKASDAWYWLRDVYGYTSSYYYFSIVYTDGSPTDYYVRDSSGGVRPLITVG